MKGILRFLYFAVILAAVALAGYGGYRAYRWWQEQAVLKEVIERLSADSRAAEILVTQSRFNEQTKKIETTIKFLEYDAQGHSLPPRFFTFQGNIIQFQALVIRFQDRLIKAGDRLRGRSAYLFLRAFVLDEKVTQVFNLGEFYEVPAGYKLPGTTNEFEKELWSEFWNYALDPSFRQRMGVKNAQIEAPGSIFLPGTIYTLKIEHDGGLRIDTEPIPEILKGEKI